jgi:hypothetical protein
MYAFYEEYPEDDDMHGPAGIEFEDTDSQADKRDILIISMTPEERFRMVPKDYWRSARGKAVEALLKAQGKPKAKRGDGSMPSADHRRASDVVQESVGTDSDDRNEEARTRDAQGSRPLPEAR